MPVKSLKISFKLIFLNLSSFTLTFAYNRGLSYIHPLPNDTLMTIY